MIAFASQTFALDKQGKFAIKGVGNVSCKSFNALIENENSYEKFMFVGWMNGYITAHNQHLSDNFDVVSWETSETLAGYLVAHCHKNPQLSYFQAVTQLVNELYKDRIKEFVPDKNSLQKNSVEQVYIVVVQRVQQKLTQLGYYSGKIDGLFSPECVAAITKFKQKNNLVSDKLLDQKTLFVLLKES